MSDLSINRYGVDPAKYIIASYRLKSRTNLWDAAYALAVGQSIGNPSIRNSWETDQLYEDHCAKILCEDEDVEIWKQAKAGNVSVAFPVANINWQEDGVSQLLCFLMGGQLDIDIIESCQLQHIYTWNTPGKPPKFGISGIRQISGAQGKPILGGIVKPKTGLSPIQLLSVVQEMVEGGVNFIKEDEILGNPACCPLKERLRVIQPYLTGKPVVYCYCINGDYPYCIDRARMVADAGGNGVHINFWAGLGVYKTLRDLDLPLFIHFQKSGDKILTNKDHAHHISWNVICQLAALMGVDSIHAGMWGGYSDCSEGELKQSLTILQKGNVIPALSCGMHPGLVNKVTSLFGVDYIANVGGAIHGHPGGTKAGTTAMRQAIDGTFGPEYEKAIAKWGLVE